MTAELIFNRQALFVSPDPSRVVVRPFRPALEPRDFNPVDKTRANHIVDRVLALEDEAVEAALSSTLANFDGRHRNLLAIFENRAREMEGAFALHPRFSEKRCQLIGAYFLHEYSFEAAALFNPSIVPHPDQANLPEGALRFILSLRAVGEGHVSSLTFRSGIIEFDGTVSIDASARLAVVPTVHRRVGDLLDLGFEPEGDIAERVIFPVTEMQANGIEDARFVAFEGEGEATWYATYTAYNGRQIRSEMLVTNDFLSFRMAPLKGPAARNKGMALFPRKIGGRYAMLARHDNENLHLLYSDDILDWDLGKPVLRPENPWEFVQIGNCGSPIELDEGWLVFTHGVGPIRRYAIGAALLDKDDPSKVLGRLREPLVQPETAEREGYVPNVVYSCGALKHGGRIILPYAISDSYSTFATVDIRRLLDAMSG